MTDMPEQKMFEAHDIAAAASLLTRLPIALDHARAGQRAATAVWAYPVVGAAIGLVAGMLGWLALWVGALPQIAAALTLASLALLTGALHEDGLSDCADGLGGGNTREKRLEIMKDSRIGAYGAVALGIALIARTSGIEALMAGPFILLLMAVGAASRLPMVLAMYLMKNARGSGLSASVGAPPAASVVVAIALSFGLSMLLVGWSGIFVFCWALLAAVPLLMLAQRLIGGQTGDILGGAQQCAEIAALAAAAASL